MKIIVTGASGFVGQHLMANHSHEATLIALSLQSDDWKSVDFTGVQTIIHLAGKAHQMSPIDDSIYFQVNTELTKQLYQKAVASGVPHFIYVSSTKVYGDGNFEYLDENSDCNPMDAYGKSKWQTEKYLQEQHAKVAIVRPPLVYGKGVKGNMEKLVALCAAKSWLPFGNINNKRAMVYVGNLTALLMHIARNQSVGVFVAGDEKAVSTTQLVKSIAAAQHKNIKLFAIPHFIRAIIKKIKPALYVRLFGSFYIANQSTNKELNFTPPFSFEQGIKQMIN